MIIESLIRLAEGGFQIRDYQYTGFGSIFFIDFILFRKYLGMTNMLSIEHSQKVKKRVSFNKPYGMIRLEFGEAAEFIPKLDQDLKHLLWLDYDAFLNSEMISDIRTAAASLSLGSILLITVDIESPAETPKERQQFFRSEAGDLFDDSPVRQSALGEVNAKILENAIKNGLAGRTNAEFSQLYNFVYADGHRMLTFGGMIVGDGEKRKLSSCKLEDACYVRRNLKLGPFEIKPPVLTRKERMYLDACMPCEDEWEPEEFEIANEALIHYRDIYPFFPLYVETLI
jgi:hypothetical protein